jgi:hypothetical protein
MTDSKIPTFRPSDADMVAGGKILAAAKRTASAIAAQQTAARVPLTSAGFLSKDGAWQKGPEGLTLRALAHAITPQTGAPKRTTWVPLSGDARKSEVESGSKYGQWLTSAETVRQALQRAYNAAPGAPDPVKRKPSKPSKVTPPKAPAVPAIDTAPRDDIAREASAMLRSIAKGAKVEGLTVKAAKALQDAAAEADALRAPAAPKSADPVAAILAMSDEEAHAAMRRIAAALAKRPGANRAQVAAAAEYVKRHAQSVEPASVNT